MQLKPMKILIIEDDVNECNDFMHSIKSRNDIELVGMTDSDIEALKIIKVKHPEGIVLDLELNNSTSGNMDSFGFLKALRKSDLSYNPIIIVATHVNSKRTYDMLHKNGVDLILYKDHPKYSCERVLNNFINLREILPNKTVAVLEAERKEEKEKISECINEQMDLIGIASKLVGRDYIHDGIMYLIQNDNPESNVMQYLAKIYKKPNSTITNGIQNAIKHAWRKTAIDDLEFYYTATVNHKTGVPTAMEFLYYYKDKIKKMI